MCVSCAKFPTSNRKTQRCPRTAQSRADDSRRLRTRRARECVAVNAPRVFDEASASAVAAVSPDMLSSLLISLEAVSPEISQELLRTPKGGTRTPPDSFTDLLATGPNGQSPDLAKIEMASALCERSLIETGAYADPLRAAAELDRLDTRIDAVASGAASPPPPGTKFDELPEAVQNFYRRHTVDEVLSMTTVSQRVADRLFDEASGRAAESARPRVPSAALEAEPALTVGDLMDRARAGERPAVLADGVEVSADARGRLTIAVDGLRLPVEANEPASAVLARIPAVEFGSKKTKRKNPSSIDDAVEALITGNSPRAQSMQIAARRRTIERAFYLPNPDDQSTAGRARAIVADRLLSAPPVPTSTLPSTPGTPAVTPRASRVSRSRAISASHGRRGASSCGASPGDGLHRAREGGSPQAVRR
ncbi:Uncharacterised protein (plasmid) [Tsukamurella tyrosinosolvens]|nr:Uncharacterised protein [Tsukamurella tyrosinosolvens]